MAQGVLSAGVAFGPASNHSVIYNIGGAPAPHLEVLDMIFADGSLWQFDATGAHRLGRCRVP